MRRLVKLLESKDLPASVFLCCAKYMKGEKPELPLYNSDLGRVCTAAWFMFGRKIALFCGQARRTRWQREQPQACRGAGSPQSSTCGGCFHRVESATLWMKLFSWVRQVLNLPMWEVRTKISKREVTEFSDSLCIWLHRLLLYRMFSILCCHFLTYKVID